MFGGFEKLDFFVEFLEFFLEGGNELFGLSQSIFFGRYFWIQLCVLILKVHDPCGHIGLKLNQIAFNLNLRTLNTLLTAFPFEQFPFQFQYFFFPCLLNLIQHRVMVVDPVQKLVNKIDQLLSLTIQNVVSRRIQDQVLGQTALGFHFLYFWLEGGHSLKQLLFLELYQLQLLLVNRCVGLKISQLPCPCLIALVPQQIQMFFPLFLEILKLFSPTKTLEILFFPFQDRLCITTGVIHNQAEPPGLFLI